MENAGDMLMTMVLILGAGFGALALVLYGVKRLINAIKARRRQRRIEAAFANLPLVQERPAEGPRHPRVLYAPSHDPEHEHEHEADMIIPHFVLSPFQADLTTRSLPEPFEGKGGESGGAGASGEWDNKTVEPEQTSTFETSETTIDVPSTDA